MAEPGFYHCKACDHYWSRMEFKMQRNEPPSCPSCNAGADQQEMDRAREKEYVRDVYGGVTNILLGTPIPVAVPKDVFTRCSADALLGCDTNALVTFDKLDKTGKENVTQGLTQGGFVAGSDGLMHFCEHHARVVIATMRSLGLEIVSH